MDPPALPFVATTPTPTPFIAPFPPRPAPTLSYDWQEISSNAKVLYLRDAEKTDQALENLTSGPLGFDLEWKPTFTKGGLENPVALVQLAADDMIYLIQVSSMKTFPARLKEILEDPAIIKAGVGIQNDAKKLYADWKVATRGCVDLSLLARTVDNQRWKGKYNLPIGLARLVEAYEYRLLEKGRINRSNWESNLTAAQQAYASNDAHAGYTIYKRLVAMIDPLDSPSSSYYTFSVFTGSLCETSGKPWAPHNPNYDPGPLPPPRPPRPPRACDVRVVSEPPSTSGMHPSTGPAYQGPTGLPTSLTSRQWRLEQVNRVAEATRRRQSDRSHVLPPSAHSSSPTVSYNSYRNPPPQSYGSNFGHRVSGSRTYEQPISSTQATAAMNNHETRPPALRSRARGGAHHRTRGGRRRDVSPHSAHTPEFRQPRNDGQHPAASTIGDLSHGTDQAVKTCHPPNLQVPL